MTIKEADKELDNKFKDVCPTCGDELHHVTKDYNICTNDSCPELKVFADNIYDYTK